MFRTAVSASVFALMASTAVADIKAEDVWAQYQAIATATGGTMTGTATRDGDALTVSDVNMAYALPFGIAQIDVAVSDITLTDNVDGTVVYAPSAPITISANINVQGEDPVGITLNAATEGYVTTASGTPDDITYVSKADKMVITVDALDLPDDLVVNVDGDITMTDYSGESRIAIADMITLTETSNFGSQAFDLNITGDGFEMQQSSITGPMSGETSTVLMADGADIMNLTPAFAAGMMFKIATDAASSESTQKMFVDGELVSSQVTSSGRQVGNVTLDKNGLSLGADIATISAEMTTPELPFPVAFDFTRFGVEMGMPIMASEAEQDVKYMIDLEGLRVAPELWSLIDPAKALPHDPADVKIDLSAKVINGIDLFDVPGWMQREQTGDFPITIEDLTINAARVAALGAVATADGGFAFDNTDLETFDGMPRPEGDATLVVNGANTVIDLLIGAGLMSEDDAMGARMGIGMFGRVTGDDEITAKVEVNAEGHVLVNDQRMR